MNILEEIVQHKHQEVAARKASVTIAELERSEFFTLPPLSLKKSVEEGSGIIAEIKRKSPSKGVINPNVSVDKISTGYTKAGASGLSVLTDEKYFGGTSDDLMLARRLNKIPILRKDFIVDEFQIIEARSIGANAILLIAASLTPVQIRAFTKFAHALQLEVLLEVHNEKELLDNIDAEVDLVGVNNRDLKSFSVDISISKRLASLIPDRFTKVSESGIEKVDTILELKQVGYKGFLMGQNFMQNVEPGEACRDFIEKLKAKS